MTATLGVHSEVGRLAGAVVHRPGLELTRLTPSNCAELLFDDVLWADKARQEHDRFTDVLREHGVDVHYFGDLLAELVPQPAAVFLRDSGVGDRLGPVLANDLRNPVPHQLAEAVHSLHSCARHRGASTGCCPAYRAAYGQRLTTC